MADYRQASIRIRNYKCFGNKPEGFESICPVNIIIGKNNSGKSTLLDLLQMTVTSSVPGDQFYFHNGQPPQLLTTVALTKRVLDAAFPENVSGGGVPGRNWSDYGKKFSDAKITFVNAVGTQRTLFSVEPELTEIRGQQSEARILQEIERNEGPLFNSWVVHRLYAERNILAEAESDNLSIDGHGFGATSLIQNYLHRAKYQKKIISRDFLRDLNSIVEPNYSYKEIDCRRQENGQWEVFLDEEHKGHIAISQTGSGVKTIILALLFLKVLPQVSKKDLSNTIFAFEELENNLHPAIQRRLLKFIEDFVLENKSTVFMTTHSSIAIDLFSHSNNAQILHVTHDNKVSTVRRTSTVVDNRGVLDDLDIRSSDILQSNGIIWVEGPSDRLYINRWISLFSEGQLQEGMHYQCLFYGGRLLAYLTATDEPPELADRAVKILTINRNAVAVIDSDKSDEEERINATKERIIQELSTVKGMSWVTDGREIENYIPVSVLRKYYKNDALKPVPQFGKFEDYLDTLSAGDGKEFVKRKPLFAERILPYFTREDLLNDPFLSKRLAELSAAIKSWNGI